MKTLKIFENATVVSVNNGEIWIKVDSEIEKYHNAALVSVNNGIVKIENCNPLTKDVLENGRIVEYESGERRLVLKDKSGHAILVGQNSWASDPLNLKNAYKIVKVYEATFFGSLDAMLKDAYELVWEE